MGTALLDIGAGVGAVHTALLEAGAATAVDVDASRQYLTTASGEAERRGLADRVEYRYGDVVELGAELPAADIVALDSVICCYPYLPALLQAALRPGPQLAGLTYPRDTWWMRGYMRLWNLGHALRRSPARYFIYRHAEVNRLMAEAGFVSTHEGGHVGVASGCLPPFAIGRPGIRRSRIGSGQGWRKCKARRGSTLRESQSHGSVSSLSKPHRECAGRPQLCHGRSA